MHVSPQMYLWLFLVPTRWVHMGNGRCLVGWGRVALKTSQQLQTDSAWLRERAPHKDRASLCSLMATLTAGQTFLPPSHPSLPPAVTSLSILQPLAPGCPNSEGPKTSRCGSAMFLQAQLNLGMTSLPKEASTPPSPFLISKASP